MFYILKNKSWIISGLISRSTDTKKTLLGNNSLPMTKKIQQKFQIPNMLLVHETLKW